MRATLFVRVAAIFSNVVPRLSSIQLAESFINNVDRTRSAPEPLAEDHPAYPFPELSRSATGGQDKYLNKKQRTGWRSDADESKMQARTDEDMASVVFSGVVRC